MTYKDFRRPIDVKAELQNVIDKQGMSTCSGLRLHDLCVATLARIQYLEGIRIEDIGMDDPDSTPQMNALQIRFQDAIARTLLKELQAVHPVTATTALSVINALGFHMVSVTRTLRKDDLIRADGIKNFIRRLEIHLLHEAQQK